jgi:hypothetical protein
MYSSTGTKSTFESIKQPHLGEPAASSDCRLKSRTAWVRPGESAAVREPESAGVRACRCARASEIQEVRDGAPPPPTSTPLAALREPCTCIHVCMADKGLSPSIAAAGQWRLVNICAAHLRPGDPSSRLPPRRARRAPRRAWSPARQRWPALGDSDPGPDPWGSFMRSWGNPTGGLGYLGPAQGLQGPESLYMCVQSRGGARASKQTAPLDDTSLAQPARKRRRVTPAAFSAPSSAACSSPAWITARGGVANTQPGFDCAKTLFDSYITVRSRSDMLNAKAVTDDRVAGKWFF